MKCFHCGQAHNPAVCPAYAGHTHREAVLRTATSMQVRAGDTLMVGDERVTVAKDSNGCDVDVKRAAPAPGAVWGAGHQHWQWARLPLRGEDDGEEMHAIAHGNARLAPVEQ